jgi:hypothetical protein
MDGDRGLSPKMFVRHWKPITSALRRLDADEKGCNTHGGLQVMRTVCESGFYINRPQPKAKFNFEQGSPGWVTKRGGDRVLIMAFSGMAKELAMVERNEQGRAVRRYLFSVRSPPAQRAELPLSIAALKPVSVPPTCLNRCA